ncbi:MAG: MOSC domain-containing protein [candidate division WOR-3 bacterium]
MKGKVIACAIAEKKGVPKKEVPFLNLIENYGAEGDAHAGGERQVSLLALESTSKMKIKLEPGTFGENILTQGIHLKALNVGTKLKVGEAILEITHIGKKCHTKCAIYYAAGTCIMPVEGVFARVIKGGKVEKGTEITVIDE